MASGKFDPVHPVCFGQRQLVGWGTGNQAMMLEHTDDGATACFVENLNNNIVGHFFLNYVCIYTLTMVSGRLFERPSSIVRSTESAILLAPQKGCVMAKRSKALS